MAPYVHANEQSSPNPIANARIYWKISAPVLLVVAALGFLLNATGLGAMLGGFLTFDPAHNAVHALIGVIGLFLGYGAASYALARGVAKVFGIVYLGLALVGFLSATVFGLGNLLGLHLELGENLIHVALGAWAVYAGFAE